jgi:lysophospholipase L1-like esterase
MKQFLTILVSAGFMVITILSSTPVYAQPQQQSNSGMYYALGDSIAAGAGAGTPTDNNGCWRSTGAYPYQVAQAKGLQLIHVACGGATAEDLVTQQHVNGPNPQAQLDVAYAHGVPALITITAGANGMQWSGFLRKCVAGVCGTSTDSAATKALRFTVEEKLRFAFSEIERRSNGKPPRVVITGYSNPISNYCKGRQSYVSNTEINWLNKERDQLNKTIRKSMKGFKFVRYASSDFTGHTICAKEPWHQGLNDAAPLHPNARGQQEIAKNVLRAAR